jgi:hypothetical protein
LLRIYKNALLQAIREAGFDPRDFEAEETTTGGYLPDSTPKLAMTMKLPALNIRYRDDQLEFTVRSDSEDVHKFDYAFTKFTPTYPRVPPNLNQFLPGKQFVAFDQVLPAFQKWLHREVSQAVEDDAHPDLWAQLSSHETLATDLASAQADESTFSVEERVQIQIALREFRLLVVKTFEPRQGELEIISERLDYLSRAADRLNRFDWKGVAVSTILGMATTLTLDTEKGRILWGLFLQAMSSVGHLLR